jgi:hypothetical protein
MKGSRGHPITAATINVSTLCRQIFDDEDREKCDDAKLI